MQCPTEHGAAAKVIRMGAKPIKALHDARRGEMCTNSHIVAATAGTSDDTAVRLMLKNTTYRATAAALGPRGRVDLEGLTKTDTELHLLIETDRFEEERMAELRGEYTPEPGTIRRPNPWHEGSAQDGPDHLLF